MIDEFFDQWIDRLCRTIPAYIKPRRILFSNSCIGWRVLLYGRALLSKVSAAFGHISSEENMDLFMRETAERGDDGIAWLKAFWKEQAQALLRLEKWGRTIRFTALLVLMLLACFGTAATNGPGMPLVAASLCVLWISTAIECGYKPICGRLRQRYLAQTLLRTGAISLMLVHYFGAYVGQGVPSNIVLQSTMIIMLFVHAALYLAFVLLNTRQPLFLRALAGITGVMPALTAASALAVAASSFFRPWPLSAAGVLGALGALLTFMGDELITITQLGGIRLKYYAIWVCLLMTGGCFAMLLGTWMYAL